MKQQKCLKKNIKREEIKTIPNINYWNNRMTKKKKLNAN